MSAHLISQYPPGPCGHCGRPFSFYSQSEICSSDFQDENGNRPIKFSGECISCGTSTKKSEECKSVFGGRKGYGVGLDGAFFLKAKFYSGFTKYEKFKP
jgi:hypothetical protein